MTPAAEAVRVIAGGKAVGRPDELLRLVHVDVYWTASGCALCNNAAAGGYAVGYITWRGRGTLSTSLLSNPAAVIYLFCFAFCFVFVL